MHPGKPHGKKASGSVIVLTAIMATVLFGVMGLAIEVAGFYSLKRKMQTAADAGAKAGAIELWNGTANWLTEARRGTSQNGYTHGVDGVTVTVNSPPTTRASAIFQSNRYVEVIVQQPQNLHLMTILTNQRTKTVTAWAVGGPVPTTGAQIVVLNPTAADSFEISGGGSINIPGGIVVDSNHGLVGNGRALELHPGTLTAGFINVVGDALCNGGCIGTVQQDNASLFVPDPLASIPAPTGYTTTCDAAHTNRVISSGTVSLSAGTYCGGITVQSGATANLGAGLYVLLGGGLYINGGHINGTDLTFYNTYDGSHAFGHLKVQSGSSTLDLSAQTSGSLAGMLWFNDRTAPTCSGTNCELLSGGGDFKFTGALYFNRQELHFQGGNTGQGAWTMIIADQLTFSGGSSTLTSDFSGPVPLPITKPSLVE